MDCPLFFLRNKVKVDLPLSKTALFQQVCQSFDTLMSIRMVFGGPFMTYLCIYKTSPDLRGVNYTYNIGPDYDDSNEKNGDETMKSR